MHIESFAEATNALPDVPAMCRCTLRRTRLILDDERCRILARTVFLLNDPRLPLLFARASLVVGTRQVVSCVVYASSDPLSIELHAARQQRSAQTLIRLIGCDPICG